MSLVGPLCHDLKSASVEGAWLLTKLAVRTSMKNCTRCVKSSFLKDLVLVVVVAFEGLPFSSGFAAARGSDSSEELTAE
jgi:hypothetical protein